MYPKAAVDVSMLVPSISHAQIPNPVKCKIPSQSPGFSSFQPKNYPLDLRRPTFLCCVRILNDFPRLSSRHSQGQLITDM